MSDEEGAYRWLWAVTFACGCVALSLCIAYYLRNRDLTIFDTFKKPDPSLNGNGPAPSEEILDPSEVE